MSNTATPRDLDPKFKDAQVPTESTNSTDAKGSAPEGAKESSPEGAREALARLSSSETANDPGEGFIVHRQRFTDSRGNTGEKVHGPMPVGDWAEYSRKNGL